VIDFNANPSSPNFELVAAVSSGTVPAQSTLPACGASGNYGVYVSVSQNLVWINRVMSGLENASAVDSRCVTAGNCVTAGSSSGGTTGSVGGGGTSSGFPILWIIVAAVVGSLALLLLILCLCRCCRKHKRPPKQQVAPVPMTVYHAPQPQVQPPVQTVQVYYTGSTPDAPPSQVYNAPPMMYAGPAMYPASTAMSYDNPFAHNQSGPWICSACTFQNATGSNCQMCASARPPPAMNPAAYPEAYPAPPPPGAAYAVQPLNPAAYPATPPPEAYQGQPQYGQYGRM
jgi:hypothetical protein